MYQYMFQGGETYPFGYVGSETINNIIHSLWLIVLLVWDIVRERKIVFTIVNSWVVKHVPQLMKWPDKIIQPPLFFWWGGLRFVKVF